MTSLVVFPFITFATFPGGIITTMVASVSGVANDEHCLIKTWLPSADGSTFTKEVDCLY